MARQLRLKTGARAVESPRRNFDDSTQRNRRPSLIDCAADQKKNQETHFRKDVVALGVLQKWKESAEKPPRFLSVARTAFRRAAIFYSTGKVASMVVP